MLATAAIVFYLAFGVPVVVAGVATTRFGLHDTAVGYSAGLAVLSAAAAGILVGGVAQLTLRGDDRGRAREGLLGLLADAEDNAQGDESG